MEDKYPGDVLAEIRQLRARVETLEAQLRQRDGLTTASAGWKIGDMAAPPTPVGGGYLFSSGGDPLWKDSGGVTHDLITPPFPQASSIANQASMLAGASAPSTYSDTYLTNLREDVRATRQFAFDLTTKLRTTTPPIILT